LTFPTIIFSKIYSHQIDFRLEAKKNNYPLYIGSIIMNVENKNNLELNTTIAGEIATIKFLFNLQVF